MLFKGYTEANNKMLKLHNASKPTSHIINLNSNTLYGHSMIQLLPTEILD